MLRSSTSAVSRRLGRTVSFKHPESKLVVTLTLPDELEENLLSLSSEIGLIKSGEYSIEELIRQFNNLTKLSDEKYYQGLFNSKRINIEYYKLAIMQAIQDYLNQFYNEQKPVTKNKKTLWQRIGKWVRFGLFLFGDLVWFPSGIYFSYIGFRALMPLIFPAITNIVMLPIAIALTMVDIGIQILFKTITIKDKLKIPIGQRTKRFLDIYQSQLKTTTKINELLQHPTVLRQINREDFHIISNLALKFTHKDMVVKKEQIEQLKYKPYGKEHVAKKVLRWIIRGFKIFTTITGGFFAAQMLVGLAFAPLLGTPAGWVLIAFLVAGLLAMYLATMHYDSLKGLFSPSLDRFKQVKNEFDSFTVVKDFRHIYQNKFLFKQDTSLQESLRSDFSEQNSDFSESTQEEKLIPSTKLSPSK